MSARALILKLDMCCKQLQIPELEVTEWQMLHMCLSDLACRARDRFSLIADKPDISVHDDHSILATWWCKVALQPLVRPITLSASPRFCRGTLSVSETSGWWWWGGSQEEPSIYDALDILAHLKENSVLKCTRLCIRSVCWSTAELTEPLEDFTYMWRRAHCSRLTSVRGFLEGRLPKCWHNGMSWRLNRFQDSAGAFPDICPP